MQEWVAEMAAYVKLLDSNHLMTIGEEGFYPDGLHNPNGVNSYGSSHIPVVVPVLNILLTIPTSQTTDCVLDISVE